MNQKIVINEHTPGTWAIGALTTMGMVGGRSTFPTASHAFHHAKRLYPTASIVVRLVADDQRIPDQVRVALSRLQQHGYGQAGKTYRISRYQLDEMGLDAAEIHALSSVNIPHLGRTPALMTSQNIPEHGDAELELVCDLV